MHPITDHETPAWVIVKAALTPATDCWQWQGSHTKRYGGQGGDRAIVSSGAHKGRTVARVMWEELRGPLPSTHVIRHTCDNPMCIRPAHLIAGTHQDNTTDARIRGRLRPGGRAYEPQAKAS